MTTIRQALGFSFLERFLLIGVNLIFYILIARLLTPHQIGLYSVVAALLGVIQVVREFGVGTYFIQAKDLDQSRLNSALGFSVTVAIFLFLATWFASPTMANFYADPEIVAVLRVAALSLLILPFCSISQSILRRKMQFRDLMKVNLVGALCGFVVTIILAINDFGPICLAWGAVANNFSTAATSWIFLEQQNRPNRLGFSGWGTFIEFGRQITGASIITTISIDINDLVIGRVMSLESVAMLSRAMGPMSLWQRDLMTAARNVALPAFASANRDGSPIEPIYLKSFSAVLVLSLPYYGFLGLFPLEFLRILAGPQWDAAAPLVVVFSIAGAFTSFSTLIPSLLTSVGRVDLASRADILFAILRVLTVVTAAFWVGSLMSISIAFLVAFAISPLLFLYYKNKCVPNDVQLLLTLSKCSLGVAGISLTPALLYRIWAGFDYSSPINMPVFFALGASVLIIWFFSLRLFNHPLSTDPIYLKTYSHIFSFFKIRNTR